MAQRAPEPRRRPSWSLPSRASAQRMTKFAHHGRSGASCQRSRAGTWRRARDHASPAHQHGRTQNAVRDVVTWRDCRVSGRAARASARPPASSQCQSMETCCRLLQALRHAGGPRRTMPCTACTTMGAMSSMRTTHASTIAAPRGCVPRPQPLSVLRSLTLIGGWPSVRVSSQGAGHAAAQIVCLLFAGAIGPGHMWPITAAFWVGIPEKNFEPRCARKPIT